MIQRRKETDVERERERVRKRLSANMCVNNPVNYVNDHSTYRQHRQVFLKLVVMDMLFISLNIIFINNLL